jgi:hypothetical protein
LNYSPQRQACGFRTFKRDAAIELSLTINWTPPRFQISPFPNFHSSPKRNNLRKSKFLFGRSSRRQRSHLERTNNPIPERIREGKPDGVQTVERGPRLFCPWDLGIIAKQPKKIERQAAETRRRKEELSWFDFNFILILAALRLGDFALNSFD